MTVNFGWLEQIPSPTLNTSKEVWGPTLKGNTRKIKAFFYHDFKRQLDNTKKKITDYSANYMIPIQVTFIRTTLAQSK